MKKAIGKILAILMAALLCLTACSNGDSKDSDEIVIGVTMYDYADIFFLECVQTLEAEAAKLGNVQLIMHDAKTNVNEQTNAIENFIQQGVDAIIISPVEIVASDLAVKKARDAGIPVVGIADPLDNVSCLVTISETLIGTQCGEMAAEWLNNTFGGDPVDVAVIDYPNFPNCIERADAMVAATQKGYPNINVVFRQAADLPEDGMREGEVMLQANPDIKLVISIIDGATIGVSNAFKAAGKTGDDIGMFTIGASPHLLDEMNKSDSIIRGTVDLNAPGISIRALDEAIKLATGGTVTDTLIIQDTVKVYPTN